VTWALTGRPTRNRICKRRLTGLGAILNSKRISRNGANKGVGDERAKLVSQERTAYGVRLPSTVDSMRKCSVALVLLVCLGSVEAIPPRPIDLDVKALRGTPSVLKASVAQGASSSRTSWRKRSCVNI